VTAGSATGVVRFEPDELGGPEGARSPTKLRHKNRENIFYNALVTAASEAGVTPAALESLPSVAPPVPSAGVAVVFSSAAEPPPHSHSQHDHSRSQRTHMIVVVEDRVVSEHVGRGLTATVWRT
jgi:hypothetical protein